MYTREGPVSLQKYRGAHERLGGSPKQETVDMTLDVSCTIDDGIDPDVENKTRPPTAFNMPSRGPCRSDAEPRYETKILCEFLRAPFRKRPTELRVARTHPPSLGRPPRRTPPMTHCVVLSHRTIWWEHIRSLPSLSQCRSAARPTRPTSDALQ